MEKLWNKCIQMFKYREKISNVPQNVVGIFRSAVDNTGVTSMRYRSLSVISYLKLYLFVFCLCSFPTATKPHHRWRQKGSPLSTLSGL
jgi:hypothetical protein